MKHITNQTKITRQQEQIRKLIEQFKKDLVNLHIKNFNEENAVNRSSASRKVMLLNILMYKKSNFEEPDYIIECCLNKGSNKGDKDYIDSDFEDVEEPDYTYYFKYSDFVLVEHAPVLSEFKYSEFVQIVTIAGYLSIDSTSMNYSEYKDLFIVSASGIVLINQTDCTIYGYTL